MYIKPIVSESGAYPPPQSLKAEGLILFPDKLIEKFVKYNGFVILTIKDNAVTSIKANTKAWEEWKATLPTEPEPEDTPTNTGGEAVTWEELDNAYNEGVNGAYEQ